MPRRSRVGVVLIAIALAVALAILLSQARAVVGGSTGGRWRVGVAITAGP